jgi:hypothetical protein
MRSFFKKAIIIYLSSWLIAAAPVHAQDSVSIKEGDPAPFDGTLLTHETAAKLLVEASSCDEKIEIVVTKAQEEAKAQCSLEKEMLNITIDTQKQRYDSALKLQDTQLDYMIKAATKPKISRETVFIIGVLSGVAITAVSAYSISAASQIPQ